MGRLLRITVAAIFLLASGVPAVAAAIDDNLMDSAAIAQLELRAQQAKPREQCFLYTELVHIYTELAGRQMLAGDIELAAATLKRVEHYAQLVHMDLADDTKRVMNAQILMHHTTRRLDEYVRKASFEDRETLQATLKQLNRIEDELLTQVFAH